MFLAVVYVKICTAKHYIICNVDKFFRKSPVYCKSEIGERCRWFLPLMFSRVLHIEMLSSWYLESYRS